MTELRMRTEEGVGNVRTQQAAHRDQERVRLPPDARMGCQLCSSDRCLLPDPPRSRTRGRLPYLRAGICPARNPTHDCVFASVCFQASIKQCFGRARPGMRSTTKSAATGLDTMRARLAELTKIDVARLRSQLEGGVSCSTPAPMLHSHPRPGQIGATHSENDTRVFQASEVQPLAPTCHPT